MPIPGDIEDGYRFKGGDPSKQENWELVRAASRPPMRSSLQGGLTAARAAFPPAVMEAIRPAMDVVKPSVLPTIGSVALPAAATALAGPANAPFIPIEQGAGAVGGTYLNKLLGITDPTALDYALAGGVSPALSAGSNILRAIKPVATTTRAAETLQPLSFQPHGRKSRRLHPGRM